MAPLSHIRAAEVGTLYVLFLAWKPILVVLEPADIEVLIECFYPELTALYFYYLIPRQYI